MTVTGERYYRLMDGERLISRHLSIEECIERAVVESRGRRPASYEILAPAKKLRIF